MEVMTTELATTELITTEQIPTEQMTTKMICPGCHAKRLTLWTMCMGETLFAPVPHRQVVLTIPKRLRAWCLHRRRLLGDLARVAARTVTAAVRTLTHDDDLWVSRGSGGVRPLLLSRMTSIRSLPSAQIGWTKLSSTRFTLRNGPMKLQYPSLSRQSVRTCVVSCSSIASYYR
jgi:hypothetical protein